jgi:DNA-nicking Smr family endonuclease
MRKRQKDTRHAPPAAGSFHHQPFRNLKPRTTPPSSVAAPLAPPAPTPPAAVQPSDETLFAREMADVQPLSPRQRQRVVPPPPAPAERTVTDPDAEALAELSDLVTGVGSFDIADTVEFVEGAVTGLDRRLVRRLRGGDFAYQSYLDLHGMTAEAARHAVDQFLNRAVQQGQRCVLIIHGRGLNSKDQMPVLKHRLAGWLSRGAWARLVLAFTSARPCDGGAGALYVLLRRQRRPGGKQPITVTHGAKW